MEKELKIVLIAGGTGLIGRSLEKKLTNQGVEVRILTRNPKNGNEYKWLPNEKLIDEKSLIGVDTIINLAGAGIGDKRWSKAYKKELIDSRIIPTKFLLELAPKINSLKQYVSASGINCYGYDYPERVHTEEDPFGGDFLSQLVEKWEQSSSPFSEFCIVTKLRISVVLSKKGGALSKIAAPVKMYFATALGSGKQWMPWIYIDDLVHMMEHVSYHRIEGVFNAIGGAESNTDFTRNLAKVLHRPFFLPNVPAFLLKLIFGEMSTVVLLGVNASNQKVKKTGFKFKFEKTEACFEEIYKK
jgi:uncharacterized protein